MLRILQISEETKTIALENRRNIEMLKLALSSRTDDSATDDSVLQLLERPLEDTEELTAFNAELENRMKYRKIVSTFIAVFSVSLFDWLCTNNQL
jgi:hypothetical protein